MKISLKGLELIKKYEGCCLQSYLCPANVWTIGYGHTGEDVTAGKVITQAEADRLLLADLSGFEATVNKVVTLPLSQGQFDALVSFTYNCGAGNLKKLVGNGRGYPEIAEAMLLYTKAAGKTLAGLKRRREEESALFLSASPRNVATEKKLTVNLHAGHNPDGKTAHGAVGLIKESTEARRITSRLKDLLENSGAVVYDCTCNDGTSQADVLSKIVESCNAHTVDLDVGIHFNACVNDWKGNGKTTGVECLVYSKTGKSVPYAENICVDIAALGFRNRGIKIRTDLMYLKKTKAPAVLVECCFVDDADDVKLYDSEKMAAAIAGAIQRATT